MIKKYDTCKYCKEKGWLIEMTSFLIDYGHKKKTQMITKLRCDKCKKYQRSDDKQIENGTIDEEE